MPPRRFRSRFSLELLESRRVLIADATLFLYEWNVEMYENEFNTPREDRVWQYVDQGEGTTLDFTSGRHVLESQYRSSGNAFLGSPTGFSELTVKAKEAGGATRLTIKYDHAMHFESSVPDPFYNSNVTLSIDVVVYATRVQAPPRISGHVKGERSSEDTLGAIATSRITRNFSQNFSEGITDIGITTAFPFGVPQKEFDGHTYYLVTREHISSSGSIGDSNNICFPGWTTPTCGTAASSAVSVLLDIAVELPCTPNGEACQAPYIESVAAVPTFAQEVGRSDGVTPVKEPTTLRPLELQAEVVTENSDPRFEIAGVYWITHFLSTERLATPQNSSVELYFTPNTGSYVSTPGIRRMFTKTIYPSPEQYGTNKSFDAFLVYKDTWTDTTQLNWKRSDDFTIFFDKFGDDNRDGVKNWYEYWAQEKLGATSHYGNGVVANGIEYRYGGQHLYNPSTEGGETRAVKAPTGTGYYTLKQPTIITLYDPAALEWDYAWIAYPTNKKALRDLWPGPAISQKGIDGVEHVIAHELAHAWLNREMYRLEVQFGENRYNDNPRSVEELMHLYDNDTHLFDADRDGVPDDIERKYAKYGFSEHTPFSLGFQVDSDGNPKLHERKDKDGNPVIVDGEPILDRDPVLTITGGRDDELFCELASLGVIEEVSLSSAVESQDLANPGRNTNPSFMRIAAETGRNATMSKALVDDKVLLPSASEADFLRLTIPISVFDPGSYSVLATLQDAEGNLLFAGETKDFDVGDSSFQIDFDGNAIRQRRVNGPYTIRDVMLLGADFEQVLPDEYMTKAYKADEFSPKGNVELGEIANVQIVDADTDGANDQLRVDLDVELLRMTSDEATVSAFLYTTDGTALGRAEGSFIAANAETVQLTFDLAPLRLNRSAGAVELRYVSMKDAAGQEIDFLRKLTVPLILDEDVLGPRSMTSDFAVRSSLLDEDSDGVSEELQNQVEVDVSKAGSYTFIGQLYAADGTFLSQLSNEIVLGVGRHTVELNAGAQNIRDLKKDGPYTLRHLLVLDSRGQVVEVGSQPSFTPAYAWGQFTDDRDAPDSRVEGDSHIVREARFGVTWRGSDSSNGTGIRSFDVFVSEDGGAWQLWRSRVTDTSAQFQGDFGRVYSFYSRATDNALNIETDTGDGDVSVSVISPWKNIANALDVNSDSAVTLDDVFVVIGQLNVAGVMKVDPSSGPIVALPPFYDVNGDGYVSPIDALWVINYLRPGISVVAGSGEGEFREDCVDGAIGILGNGAMQETPLVQHSVVDEEGESGLGLCLTARRRRAGI